MDLGAAMEGAAHGTDRVGIVRRVEELWREPVFGRRMAATLTLELGAGELREAVEYLDPSRADRLMPTYRERRAVAGR